VEDFNAMLSDPRLYPELQDTYPPKGGSVTEGKDRIVSKDDMPLFQWLGSLLEEAGAWNVNPVTPTTDLGRNLHRFNRILLAGLLDTRTWYSISALEAHYIPLPRTFIRNFQTWGYQLVKNHSDLLNYYDVLEFKRAE
jgi:hypothetical protein